jgi:hypothetical protein
MAMCPDPHDERSTFTDDNDFQFEFEYSFRSQPHAFLNWYSFLSNPDQVLLCGTHCKVKGPCVAACELTSWRLISVFVSSFGSQFRTDEPY